MDKLLTAIKTTAKLFISLIQYFIWSSRGRPSAWGSRAPAGSVPSPASSQPLPLVTRTRAPLPPPSLCHPGFSSPQAPHAGLLPATSALGRPPPLRVLTAQRCHHGAHQWGTQLPARHPKRDVTETPHRVRSHPTVLNSTRSAALLA